MSSFMRMPKICASCGEMPSRYFSVDKQKTSIDSSQSIVKILLTGSLSTTKETTTYQVPVCDGCHQRLTIQKYIGKAIIGIGALIVCAGLFIAVTDNNQTIVPVLTNLAARLNLKVRPYDLLPFTMVIGGTVLALAGKLITLPGIFSTNGRTYKFHNKKFQAAFARLNPEKVK